MVFLDVNFIFGFTLLVFLISFTRGKYRKYILALANCLFYLYIAPSHWIYLLLIVLFITVAARNSHYKENKNLFLLSTGFVLMGLFVTKYFTFFLEIIQIRSAFLIIAPLGISFFTFKCVSFLVDAYKGEIKSFNFLDVFIYVTFFPQIISGPIERFTPFQIQLNEYSQEISYEEMKSGFIYIVFGCFEKFVISARLSIITNQVYTNLPHYQGAYIFVAMIAYSFQIYSDFDAYSNIARGMSKMLGIKTMKNFNTPYLATNMSDFWRRWHISLSLWFRDYVYIPLGGNKNGRKYFNIFIVSLVSGLWHGASLSFILWGCLHGLSQLVSGKFHEVATKCSYKLPKIISIILTFSTVTILWVFFKIQDFSQIRTLFELLWADFTWIIDYSRFGMSLNQFCITLILLGLFILFDVLRYYNKGIVWFNQFSFVWRWITYIALIFIFVLFAAYGPGFHPEDFIYIQF